MALDGEVSVSCIMMKSKAPSHSVPHCFDLPPQNAPDRGIEIVRIVVAVKDLVAATESTASGAENVTVIERGTAREKETGKGKWSVCDQALKACHVSALHSSVSWNVKCSLQRIDVEIYDFLLVAIFFISYCWIYHLELIKALPYFLSLMSAH